MGASRNKTIYHVMKQKYPILTATSLYEEKMNQNGKKRKRTKSKKRHGDVEVADAEIVMMHDKNETFMALHKLPIYNQNALVLSPPLFYSASSVDKHTLLPFIRSLSKEETREDIDCNIDHLLFTLYCLKRQQRVQAFLKLMLQNQNNNSNSQLK